MSIQRYTIEGMNSYTTCNVRGDWCKWEDVEQYTKELKADNGALARNTKQALKWVTERDERITKLAETNRLLCRDLDEAQKTIEELRGEKI